MSVDTVAVTRERVEVDGNRASYLTAGDGRVLLLLHGTYWSRVWAPVLPHLAAAGWRPVAVDLPGCGHSGGELTPETATVPRLAGWTTRFLSALGVHDAVAVAGHDIGGAVAQHLFATELIEVPRLALVNSVTYDSWRSRVSVASATRGSSPRRRPTSSSPPDGSP